ncbi:MAG: UDP-N-acetylmuramate--L-alanine ligase [Anaerolineae bacterium]|nr:UDP-N-acetylmuramate--L-alanine ligase [Anaerolineae bacterium]
MTTTDPGRLHTFGFSEVHVVGIGGAGMSAIARVLHGWGLTVHGSDRRTSPITDALQAEGIAVTIGHAADAIGAADLVLASSAVPDANPEITAARARGIRVARRPEFLSEMTAGYDVVAVSGAHGKTTVTGMLTLTLLQVGLDPTAIIGGVVANLGTNGRAGDGPYFVIEADEYRNTFLALAPRIAVVTNIEFDHPDCFSDLGFVRLAFGEFVGNIVPGGLLVACGDDPIARAVAASHQANGGRVVLYGCGSTTAKSESELEWRASGLRSNCYGGVSFDVEHAGEAIGEVTLRLPGAYNAVNALAVLAVSEELGVDLEVARGVLARFEGTARRFEVLGEASQVTVIDDYAHHPTQIRGVLAAARQRYAMRRIVAVWEPHTFSRVRALYDAFVTAFADADAVVILPIYAAREQDDGSLTAADLAKSVARAVDRGRAVWSASSLDDAVAHLVDTVCPDDVVLLMGAGDEYLVGHRLLEGLRCRVAVEGCGQ